ncbi:MAG: arginine--tRNA ligase [Chloroflexota bacterium]|nr:arginine--tRNA ligase [Chloroflexota bacterium]
MFETEQKIIEKKIRNYYRDNSLPELDEFKWVPVPFSGEWGISTPFFQTAALEARQCANIEQQLPPVPQRAQEIAAGLADYLGTPAGFSRVEAVKGYINIYFSTEVYSARVIDLVLERGQSFGCSAPNDKLVMVEFSQPNTHKAFHVAHLRSMIYGDVLCRLMECAGNGVVRANYYGDIGLHVIKWLWNYIKYHAGERPTEDTTRWMGDMYAEANRRLEENPELESEVRDIYARWDEGDPEVVALWQETRQWSLDGFQSMYDMLDIHFDRVYSNSEAEKPGKLFVDELIKNGIAEDERPEGPVIVRIDDQLGLEKEKYRVLVILRSDGTALYSTEDLALARIKFREYPLEKSFYVVDVRQSLHFQQVFKTLEIAGYPWATKCKHLPYELVNLPGNVVMASREGTVVLLEDLIRESTSRALELVEQKNPQLASEKKEEIARAVGIGAIKFPLLSRESKKVVTFDWEQALDFNGQAAPYIQYAHVRATSILSRSMQEIPAPLVPQHVLEPSEVELIDYLSRMPAEVVRASEEFKPLIITNLAYNTARVFNEFYMNCPVLKAEPYVRNFRLRLVAATKQVLANELDLLGISAPETM